MIVQFFGFDQTQAEQNKSFAVFGSRMSSTEVAEYLHSLELCAVCVSRYLNKTNFNGIENETKNGETEPDNTKKKRSNYCVTCLGLFEVIDTVADEIVAESDLASYDSKSLYTAINIPIALIIRELSIWVALVQKFPDSINSGK